MAVGEQVAADAAAVLHAHFTVRNAVVWCRRSSAALFYDQMHCGLHDDLRLDSSQGGPQKRFSVTTVAAETLEQLIARPSVLARRPELVPEAELMAFKQRAGGVPGCKGVGNPFSQFGGFGACCCMWYCRVWVCTRLPSGPAVALPAA